MRSEPVTLEEVLATMKALESKVDALLIRCALGATDRRRSADPTLLEQFHAWLPRFRL